MATAVCPSCQAPVPGGYTQCPACGYAGTITPPKGSITISPTKSKLLIGLVGVAVLFGRCGFGLLRNADNVAQVADFVQDNPFDDGYEDPSIYDEELDVFETDPDPFGNGTTTTLLPGDHLLLGGAGLVHFPTAALLTSERVTLGDDRVIWTTTDGVHTVREVLLPVGMHADGDAGLQAMVDELAIELSATVTSDVPTEWEAHPARLAHLDNADSAYDVLLLEVDDRFLGLWCRAPLGEAPELAPLLEGLELTA
jgi:hypothetical protein